ncbi:hypothetical protein [Elioraea sp.]|uniref:hypothetical protein n=1 Tax=Elioraea sp. TaxID=2185103 RepID=UPI0025BA6366|nr:hypothetical protein [Elioraea sp.]
MADTTANAVLVVKDRTYDILAGPSPTDELVLKARADVLQNLSLEQILTDLERTNDLLHVAACGVRGYGTKEQALSAKVAKLQYGLLTSCSDSMAAMITFKDASESVLTALRRAFRELYNLREDRTILVLARCEQYAKTMAETAGKLAGGFKALADGAESALEDTMTAQNMSQQEREAAEARKAKAEADKRVEEENKRVLAEQIVKAQQLYEEAKAEQAKAEDRALALEIVGSITGAIGSGVAAFAAIKGAPVLAASSAVGALAEVASGSKKKRAQAAKIATETRAEGKDKKKDKDDKPKGDKDKDGKPKGGKDKDDKPTGGKDKDDKPKGDKGKDDKPKDDKPKDDKPKGDKPKDEKPKDEKPKDEKPKDEKPKDEKPKKKSAEEKAKDDKDKAAIATGVGKAVTEAGDGIKKAGGSYAEIAKRAAEAKKQALDRLMKLQDQEREALVAIARYAESMALAAKNADGAKAAVASLQQAISALKQIVTILENAKLFWEMMARACETLGKSELRKDIEMYMGDKKKERIAEYSRDEFKAQLLLLTARWVALGVISAEYQDAIQKIRVKVQGKINASPTIEEARKIAPDLAKQLKLDIEKDLAELDKKRGATKEEHAALPA